jgi:peroxiredoxin Q/BCP
MQASPCRNCLPVGAIAPDFTAQASDGAIIRLSEFRNKKNVALIFYPADNTPVCTAQLCRIRDVSEQFQQADTVVFGINPANAQKHTGFAQRHRFPFPLLEDKGGEIAAAYGCRMIFGLIRRTVYLIDRQGRVLFAERGNPNPERVLLALRTLPERDANSTPA